LFLYSVFASNHRRKPSRFPLGDILPNTASQMKIEDYLKGNFEKHTASFLSFKNLHPVLEEFKTEILNIK
jgi:hypothetical protein